MNDKAKILISFHPFTIIKFIRDKQKEIKENFDYKASDDSGKAVGITIAAMLVWLIPVLIIGLILFIWAAVVLYQNWKTMPDWARVVALLWLFVPALPGGLIVTLVLVYVTRNTRKKKSRSRK